MTVATASPCNSTISFRLVGGRQPLILLPVRVNDSGPFDFILDTGASTSLLSLELAERLGVKTVGSKEGHGAAGKISVALAQVSSLTAGDKILKNADVGVVDLAQISKAIDTKIDGILGYNFLKSLRVTIDYRSCEVRLEDPKSVEDSARPFAELPIRLVNEAKPLVLLDVYANGHGPFQFALDTGTSTSAVTPELAKSLGVTTSQIPPLTGGGGHVQASAAELRSFEVGSARADNFSVVVSDFFTILSDVIGAKLDGIVGYNFVRNYKVVIDYPGKMLSLF
jgi:predicted aspartyl protease